MVMGEVRTVALFYVVPDSCCNGLFYSVDKVPVSKDEQGSKGIGRKCKVIF